MAVTRYRRASAGVVACGLAAIVSSSVAVPSASEARAAEAQPSSTRPNLVLVLVDDLGWSDVGSRAVNRRAAHPFHHTPALTALAREGTTFTEAYAAPTCSPTRMALLSGMNAVRPDNNVFAAKGLERGVRDPLLVPPAQGRGDGASVLPASVTTLAENLRSAGYRTGHVGKFHVTRSAEDITRQHGFDRNYGGTGANTHTDYHATRGTFGTNIDPSLDEFAQNYTQRYVDTHVVPYSDGIARKRLDALVGTPKHLTDAVGDAVGDFIDSSGAQPFFAHVGHWAVHTPIEARHTRRDLRRKYARDRRVPGGRAAAYAGMLEGVDQTLARLRTLLVSTPDPRDPGRVLADNTIVVVTSDNGGHERFGASNRPLRGGKGELDEGGIRVPWVAWSGNSDLVRPGAVNPSVIDSTDLYPTFSDLASAGVPADVQDGRSLRPAMSGGLTLRGPMFQHLPGYLAADDRLQRPETIMREGHHKLRYDYERQRFRLHDLRRDIGERRDLAGRLPSRVERMGLAMLRWVASTRAPLARLSAGHGPLRIRVRGRLYDGRRVRHYPRGRLVTIRPGAPVPLVVRSR